MKNAKEAFFTQERHKEKTNKKDLLWNWTMWEATQGECVYRTRRYYHQEVIYYEKRKEVRRGCKVGRQNNAV